MPRAEGLTLAGVACELLEEWDRWYREAAAVLEAAQAVAALGPDQAAGDFHADALERLAVLLKELPAAPLELGRTLLLGAGRSLPWPESAPTGGGR